jgi:hypothetical protein
MTYHYQNCEDQSDDGTTKPKDLQRLYKVIECPAIFIFILLE